MTPKQQRFVECYCANGFNATRAAIEAGYSEKGAEVQGSNLLRNIKVSKAIEAHKAKLTKRTEYTREKIVEMLEEDRELARENAQTSAAIQASMGIAKLHGLITDKVKAEVTQTHEEAVRELTGEQLPAVMSKDTETRGSA